MTQTPAMIARAGPGAAAYPRGIQTWNGTSPALTANPASSSTCAVVRAAPPGTCANDASMIECDLVGQQQQADSSAAPLTFPNANVIWAAPARSRPFRSAPASR